MKIDAILEKQLINNKQAMPRLVVVLLASGTLCHFLYRIQSNMMISSGFWTSVSSSQLTAFGPFSCH